MPLSKGATLADLQTQTPHLKQAVMTSSTQAQISARLVKVPEGDPNFVQRSTPFSLKREKTPAQTPRPQEIGSSYLSVLETIKQANEGPPLSPNNL